MQESMCSSVRKMGKLKSWCDSRLLLMQITPMLVPYLRFVAGGRGFEAKGKQVYGVWLPNSPKGNICAGCPPR